MSKKVLIDALYNQFSDFLKQLVSMYPEDEDLGVFNDNLIFVKNMNPMLLVNTMKTELIMPYGDKIASRDETFFMNYEYETREDVDLDIVNKLRKYYASMSIESKDIVWKYIDIIVRLSKKILE
jgi:hypothetical protein